jgi:type IV pilus assembly protein PilV
MTMNTHRQQGVMLIEALIGILIFSIGILALIGMQGTAIKNTTDARYRSDAAYLASSIASQIRLDMGNVDLYKDSNTTPHAPRETWRTQVQTSLPGINIATNQRIPSIDIQPGPTWAGDGTPSSRATIVLYWQQPGESEQHQFQLVTYVSR